MEYRNLGHSGLQVSALGLGANPFGNEVDADTAAAIVHRALDLGVNYIDTADIYNQGVSEELVGRALRGHRREVALGTKATGAMGRGPNDRGAARKHLIDALDASLRRLGTDYVDLYQMHNTDPRTPIEETLRALDDMVRSGRVRYLGCSNYADWQIVEAQRLAEVERLAPFVSAQPLYNLVDRTVEQTVLPICERYGLGVIPYFPLAGGFLTGFYQRGVPLPPGSRGANRPTFARWTTDRNWDMLEQLHGFAAARGHSVNELAIAWLLSRPVVSTVIAGADRVEHIEANAKAVDWKLTPEDLAEIDRIAPRAP